MSQSTIKMDKGYYLNTKVGGLSGLNVAIHNKNGQGLLQHDRYVRAYRNSRSQSTIKMDKGYYKRQKSHAEIGWL